MKLSTRFRFGVRIMLQMALSEPGKPVLARTLAKDQEITPKYTDQILLALRTGNLLISQRGRSGGFLLARPPHTITVFDIYEVLEGPINLVDCVAKRENCEREGQCVTREVWTALTDAMRDTLQNFTVAQLCDLHRKQQNTQDYSI
jgi:Rrf2 family protein